MVCPQYITHLLDQLDPGTRLGGARPKATIEDAQCLWLGKFPAQADRCNLLRIEFALGARPLKPSDAVCGGFLR